MFLQINVALDVLRSFMTRRFSQSLESLRLEHEMHDATSDVNDFEY